LDASQVKVKLNLHGVVTVEHVQQIEEEEYEETVKKAPAAKVHCGLRAAHCHSCALRCSHVN
jgi:hypothetical protein